MILFTRPLGSSLRASGFGPLTQEKNKTFVFSLFFYCFKAVQTLSEMDTEAAFCCTKMKRDAVVEEGMWGKVEVGVTHCSLTLKTGVRVPSEPLC